MEPDSHGVTDTRCLCDGGAVVDVAVRTSPLTRVVYRGVVVLPDFFLHGARGAGVWREEASSGRNKERAMRVAEGYITDAR